MVAKVSNKKEVFNAAKKVNEGQKYRQTHTTAKVTKTNTIKVQCQISTNSISIIILSLITNSY